MLEILEDIGRKIVMENSKKHKHKIIRETIQKGGNGITYSKPDRDSRSFFYFSWEQII